MSRVSALLEAIRGKFELPAMAAAVVVNGAVAGLGVAGRRTADPASAPATLADKFHIGSCTKAMTATLMAQLVERGLLSWSTRVGDVFADVEMHAQWRDATLLQLVSNRAGVPTDVPDELWGMLCEYRGTTPEQRMLLLNGTLCTAPVCAPGTAYHYSNAGFAIAGAMAERLLDTPFEALMARELFAPLGMASAGFGGLADGCLGHTADGQVMPGADNPECISPAGRVHCTVEDWAKFAIAHLVGARGGDALGLTSDTWRLLHTPRPNVAEDAADESYACGWNVVERGWGGRCLMHTGSNTMWFAVMWLAPEKNFAALAVTNSGSENAESAVDEVAGALIQEFLIKGAGN